MKRTMVDRVRSVANCGLAVLMGTAFLGQMSAVLVPSKMSVKAEAEDSDYNYAKLLQHSMYFYDANMCGTGVSENTQYTWRGDCHTYDAQVPMQPMENLVGTNLSQSFLDQYKDVLDPDGDGYIDVAGGYHDAGDHVKFGMPENYAASTVGWGYYEFRESYVETGQDAHVETILRYFNDYLMKCTFRDADGTVIAHCYQVGDGQLDHSFWQSPEIDTMARPAYFLTADKPQTDYAASAAASLAVNYLNFKDTDPEYAEKSLDYAKALYQFAMDNPKELSDNADGPGEFYRSVKWEDDYCWAGMWLYKATGDTTYLDEALGVLGNDYYAPPTYVHCWNDVWTGALCLIAACNDEDPTIIDRYRTISGKNEYEIKDFWSQIEMQIQNCMSGGLGTVTPDGYFWLNTWGSARYNTAAQLAALVYTKYHGNTTSEYSDWAKSQMDYLLGDNTLGNCYVVGYADNSVKYPHHRAASGLTKCEDTGEHRHVLYGALVGGPDASDQHVDTTADWIYNEVTIDYNAAFVGAAAGLYALYGSETDEVDADFPPEDAFTGDGESGSGGNEYYVRAYAVDDPQNEGAGVTKLTMLVETTSIEPKTDISVRYYFSIDEMTNKANISLVKNEQIYDQTEMETDFDGLIDGPFKYDKLENVYYFEVSWPGYNICNSNKKYQCTVGFYWGDIWDPTNDWSYKDITICEDTYQDGSETRTDYICVYSDGVLVGGIEPDGTTVEEPTEEPTTEPTTETTEDVVYGDANEDGVPSVVDVILINQFYMKTASLEGQGFTNADVDRDGDVDLTDSLNVLKSLIDLVTLPVS